MIDKIKSFFTPMITMLSIIGIAWAFLAAKKRSDASVRESQIAQNVKTNMGHTKEALKRSEKHRKKAIVHANKAIEIKQKTEKKIQENTNEDFNTIIDRFKHLNN